MLNPNAYLFTQQQQAPQFQPIKNPTPGAWYNAYRELGTGYYQPDTEVKEDSPTEEVKAEVEDNSIKAEMATHGFDPFGNPFSNWVQDRAWDVWKNTKGSWLPSANIAHNIAGNILKTDAAGYGWETGAVPQRGDTTVRQATDEEIKAAIKDLNDSGYTPTYEEDDNSLPGPETVWENNYNEAQEEANKEALGDWGADFVNTGGMPMRNPMIAYRQVGGPVPEAPPAAALPVDPAMAGGAPTVDPMAGGMAPPPVASGGVPTPPPPTPRKTFAEKVAEAKATLKGEVGLGGLQVAPADGQGDMGVIDPTGVFQPAGQELGPDMPYENPQGQTLGADDIDGHLPEGSMVMNPEASEMFAEELEMMSRGGYV